MPSACFNTISIVSTPWVCAFFAHTQGVVVLERFLPTPYFAYPNKITLHYLYGTIPYNAKIRIETIS